MDPDSGAVKFKAARSSLLCALLFAVHPIHTESVSIPSFMCIQVITVNNIRKNEYAYNHTNILAKYPV